MAQFYYSFARDIPQHLPSQIIRFSTLSIYYIRELHHAVKRYYDPIENDGRIGSNKHPVSLETQATITI